MATAWFICPYKRRPRQDIVARYPAVKDYLDLIVADGGAIACAEILGNAALCKVRASTATLATIAAGDNIVRVPNHFDLTDTLGDLTAGQRNGILAKLQALGYTAQEIQNALPANWAAVTLGQVLRFAASRRLRPRYDKATDTVICDGDPQPVVPIDLIDSKVTSGRAVLNINP